MLSTIGGAFLTTDKGSRGGGNANDDEEHPSVNVGDQSDNDTYLAAGEVCVFYRLSFTYEKLILS
jgi:hypothetical protein